MLEVGGHLLPLEGLSQLAELLLSVSSCRELLPGVAEVAVHLSLAKPEPPVRGEYLGRRRKEQVTQPSACRKR
jgi:hypothetical protein